MKKIISLFVICILCLALCSCNADKENPNLQSTKNHIHSFDQWVIIKNATCTEDGERERFCCGCSYSEQEKISALGHTATTGICTRCGETVGDWELKYYVDEFNNPTDRPYISTKSDFFGIFSNSATTNSNLRVRILIDKESVAIMLWEYGTYKVKAYSTVDYSIVFLDDKGEKHYSTGTMYRNGDRVFLDDCNLIELLQENQKVEIYMKENSKYGVDSTYLFSVDSSNFSEIYS